MNRGTQAGLAAASARWQSREEILKTHLDSLNSAELRRVRPDYYWFRFGYPALQRELACKAFNPDQPRVPAGNPDGGQWTSGGGAAASGRIRLAGPVPTGEPPELPKSRPPTSEERTRAVKEVIRRLGRFGGPIGRIIGTAYWLYEYEAEIRAALDPPRSLEELQKAAATSKAGYQRHHIVEQDAAAKDGYSRTMIDGHDNVVLIPTRKHREITGWYQKRNERYRNLTPREFLRGKSWEERRQVGIDLMIDLGVLKP